MKNLIMGTAGHIDHGKTALVRALTNFDCDTHAEEKRRGITINLGFAHLKLSDDIFIGIVDVPGHSDFINTMTSGAFAIDFVMLVIDAQCGIMPQTIEHIQIMELLGITKGIVVLTKIDLVDENSQELTKANVSSFLKKTFLCDAEILEVSSLTGKGIQELKKELLRIAIKTEIKKTKSYFRMYIDRLFTVKGFGTVVTGSSLGGDLSIEDEVYLLPSEKKINIRRIEQYGVEKKVVNAGSRISINLVGFDKKDFRRGMVVSKKKISATNIIDCKIRLTKEHKTIPLWSNATFLFGTYQNFARLHLLDKDRLTFLDTAIAQIHLSEPCIILRGDKFILRSSSNDFTLGGGEVIDPNPLHHKRRPANLINKLKMLSEGNDADFILATIKNHPPFTSLTSLSDQLNLPRDEILKILTAQLKSEIRTIYYGNEILLLHEADKQNIELYILNDLKKYHKKNPLDRCGKTPRKISESLNFANKKEVTQLLSIILQELNKNNLIKKVDDTWALKNHTVFLTESDLNQIEHVENFFKNSGMHVPLISEIEHMAKNIGLSEKKLKQILVYLTENKNLYKNDGLYISRVIINHSRKKVLEYLTTHEEGITVAKFRDIVEGNRKICILMLNIFDTEGITIREGNNRFITEKGINFRKNYERTHLLGL